MVKFSKYLILLAFTLPQMSFALDISVYDIPGEPGKCKLVVEKGNNTIEWNGKCKNLESKGVEFVEKHFPKDNNEESSSYQRVRSATEN